MGVAYKCDRCGCLYPGADKSIKFRTGSNTYISTLWIGNAESWDSGPKDLCPNCARDFKIWWEHSNISAQYQLDKITSEMEPDSKGDKSAIDVHNITTTGNPVRLPEVLTTSEEPPKIVY